MKKAFVTVMTVALFLIAAPLTYGLSEAFKDSVYNPGQLKPIDSQLKVKVGEPAPDFTLPSLSGEKISRVLSGQ